jgi:hypothetical protein
MRVVCFRLEFTFTIAIKTENMVRDKASITVFENSGIIAVVHDEALRK